MTGAELYAKHLACAADGTDLRLAMTRVMGDIATPADLAAVARWEMWEAVYSLPPMASEPHATRADASRVSDPWHASACIARAEACIRSLEKGIENGGRLTDERAVVRVLQALDRIGYKIDRMSKELEDLKAQVAANTSVEQSAITLISGLGAKLAEVEAQLAAGGADTQALKDLQSELASSQQALAAAVTANTPTAPAS